MSTGNNVYRLGTKFGVLEGGYTLNQFAPCAEEFLEISAVPSARTVTLCEASGRSFFSGG